MIIFRSTDPSYMQHTSDSHNFISCLLVDDRAFRRDVVALFRLLRHVLEQRFPGVPDFRRKVLLQFPLPDENQRLDEHVEVLHGEAGPVRVVSADGLHVRVALRLQTVHVVHHVGDRVDEARRVLLEGGVVDQTVAPRRAEVECRLDARFYLEYSQEHLLADGGAMRLQLSPRFLDELSLVRVECRVRSVLFILLLLLLSVLLLLLSVTHGFDDVCRRLLRYDRRCATHGCLRRCNYTRARRRQVSVSVFYSILPL